MKTRTITKTMTIAAMAVVLFAFLTAPAIADDENSYLVSTYTDESGRQIDKVIIAGKPPEIKAQVVMALEPNVAMGINVLADVPAYNWSYGCSATSGAMMAGYYDNNGYTNMYTGPTNGGVAPMDNSVWGHTTDTSGDTRAECPLSATHNGTDGRTALGHVDDYWWWYGNTTEDPFRVGGWPEHTYGDCTGDYMKTNQWNYSNTDGATTFYYYFSGKATHYANLESVSYHDLDGGCGLQMFFESRGYTVTDMYNQYIDARRPKYGFTFDQYKQEIDAGRPVLIHIKNPTEGHTMLGYGYDDSTNTVYLHDTWDYYNHPMKWGRNYGGMQHFGVTVIQLESLPPVITSCNIDGNETDQFAPGTDVYVSGSGLESNTNYTIWIQDSHVGDGDALDTNEDPSGAQEPVTTNSTGGFNPTLIWTIPSDASATHHEYDIVVDKQDGSEGTYNSGSDGIDSAANVVGFTAPVPELPTVALLAVGLLALVGYVRNGRKT